MIVLYNHNALTNSYANARGWHGLGGAQVINMTAMMAGVPNTAATQVIVIPGSLQQSDFTTTQNMQHVQAGLGGHGNVTTRYIAGRSSATVDRQGNIT